MSVINWKHASPIVTDDENSQSMVLYVSGRCMGMHVAFLGNFAQPVVMRVEQRCDSVLFSKHRIRLLSKELTNSWSMVSVSLCETMLHLLSWKLNNSWSIVSDSSMENRAQPVVMRVEQQLWHGIWKFCGKLCTACCYES